MRQRLETSLELQLSWIQIFCKMSFSMARTPTVATLTAGALTTLMAGAVTLGKMMATLMVGAVTLGKIWEGTDAGYSDGGDFDGGGPMLVNLKTTTLTVVSLTQLLKTLSPEENTHSQHGLHFQDGQRHVDYVLTYPLKKTSVGRSIRYTTHLLTENAVARSLRRNHQPSSNTSTLSNVELNNLGETFSAHEDHKTFRREEFQGKLRDMGLELEIAEDTQILGAGFVKIHAPWNVLCREAEFMKLKMPTKRVYEVKKSSGVIEKINQLINKVLEPIHPHVEDSQPKNIKHLSHTFSREKVHLFDLSDKDSFFDSKTRSSIGV
ncbi:anoctamin-1-like [Stigmatopora nigra]